MIWYDMMILYSVVDICMSQIVAIYIFLNFLGRFVMVSAFPWHFLKIHRCCRRWNGTHQGPQGPGLRCTTPCRGQALIFWMLQLRFQLRFSGCLQLRSGWFSGWLWCWWCLRSFLRWCGPKVGWMALYQLEIDPAVQMKSSVQQIREGDGKGVVDPDASEIEVWRWCGCVQCPENVESGSINYIYIYVCV